MRVALQVILRKIGPLVGVSMGDGGSDPNVEGAVPPADVVELVLQHLKQTRPSGEMVEVRAGTRLVGVAANRALLKAILTRTVATLR